MTEPAVEIISDESDSGKVVDDDLIIIEPTNSETKKVYADDALLEKFLDEALEKRGFRDFLYQQFSIIEKDRMSRMSSVRKGTLILNFLYFSITEILFSTVNQYNLKTLFRETEDQLNEKLQELEAVYKSSFGDMTKVKEFILNFEVFNRSINEINFGHTRKEFGIPPELILANITAGPPDSVEENEVTLERNLFLGGAMLVLLDEDWLKKCGLEHKARRSVDRLNEFEGRNLNAWDLLEKESVPQWFTGRLEDIVIRPASGKPEETILDRTEYHVSLTGIEGIKDHSLGVVVDITKLSFAHSDMRPGESRPRLKKLTLGLRVVAPLAPLTEGNVHYSRKIYNTHHAVENTLMYEGVVVETPKKLCDHKKVRYPNGGRVCIFFTCGIWRYCEPTDVFIYAPSHNENTPSTQDYYDFPFQKISKAIKIEWLKEARRGKFSVFSDKFMIQNLLRPKPAHNNKPYIACMVSTPPGVRNIINARLPSIFQHASQNLPNRENQRTFIFHPAEIIQTDCNMILLQWRFDPKSVPFSQEPYRNVYREWIFKGSLQIQKLFDRFFPHTHKEVPSLHNRFQTGKVCTPRVSATKNGKKSTSWTTGFCDLTGDDDAIENLDFVYLPIPKSSVKSASCSNGHVCTPLCANWLDARDPETVIKEYPLLLRPMVFGFERARRAGVEKHAEMPHDRLNMIYKTACKRDITNRKELDRFLVATTLSQFLEHDCFSFDMKVQVNRRVDKEKLKGFICEDFSEGKENRPIPMYNQVDNDRPPDMIYHVRPILHESARLNMEKEFLLSCNCTDGCRKNCPCNLQTAEGAAKLDACYRNYVYGRLVDIIATGIFECNSNCKCKNCIDKPCQNSIVQRGLRQDLQLFKTFKKGWGVRTMSDIPFGAFICIYAGIVRSEDEAERHGRKLGDEYFANLDYIESGERTKWDVNRNKDSGKESEDSEEEKESESDEEKMEKKDGEQAFAPASHHFINPSKNGQLRRSSRKRKKKVSKKVAKNKPISRKEKKSEKDEKSEKQIDDSDSGMLL